MIPSPAWLRAALAYAATTFAAGFVAGTVRTLMVAPCTGTLVAVGIELPMMLAISWVLCGCVLRRIAVPQGRPRAAMGLAAYAFLMAAEFSLALLLGEGAAGFVANLATPAGLLGVAGQLGFGAIPLLRR